MNKRSFIFKLFSGLAVFFLMISQAFSNEANEVEETKYYDIEIILFKNISVPKAVETNLPTPVVTPTENTVDLTHLLEIKQNQTLSDAPTLEELVASLDEDDSVQLLNDTELRLVQASERIQRSKRYSLLLHTSWRQPGLSEDKAIPVWIKAGQRFDRALSSIDAENHNTSLSKADNLAQLPEVTIVDSHPTVATDSPQTQDENATDAKEVIEDGLYELEGLITISLSRYLHTHADLVLRQAVDTNQLNRKILINHKMDEQRRMRSKKLHYLDHPEFGLLVLITPYEPEIASIENSLDISTEPQ